MKRFYIGVLLVSIFMFFTIYKSTDFKSPIQKPFLPLSPNTTTTTTLPLEWLRITIPDFMKQPRNTQEAISSNDNITLFLNHKEEKESLLTWNRLETLVDNAQSLPNGVVSIKEANIVWESLDINENHTEQLCPQFLTSSSNLELKIPCGLTQGSSITVIGIPDGLVGNFRIDLIGQPLPGELVPPIIVHYNVKLLGDKLSEEPVIVQNSWTAYQDWGVEERCPNLDPDMNNKVDDLDECNKIVGREVNRTTKVEKYFPFKEGLLSVATFRVGTEGIQLTVDGKHITAFAFRDTLEAWLVSEVRITGDFKLISILASGLPTSEESDNVVDLELLKAPPLSPLRPLDLVIGVFSTANNFKRRMAVRRTWMQHDVVRSGRVVVRFFVGLHKSPNVNLELWNEARTYGDVQLMPFVDYYSLISWKTLAICIFGTEVDSAKFVMKTDDDAFVRVDEVLLSLSMINNTRGVIYGLINTDSHPIRNPESKWYISYEEWPEEKYPPWAHGPGYIVSRDIAEAIGKLFKEGNLKMFKLEDVAMGIWIDYLTKQGLEAHYENDGRIISEGCKDGYVVAHYQSPAEMTCLWRKYRETKRSICCRDW